MPKVVDHAVRREQLAEAVARFIAAHGLEAATMRALAEATGYSTGVLAHYFADKDELLLTALRYASARTTARMAVHLEHPRAGAALRAVIHEALPLDEQRRMEWAVWVCFWGNAAAKPALAAHQRDTYRALRALLRDLVAAAQSAGAMAADQAPADTADTLLAFIDGLGLQATLEPIRLPPRRQIRLVDAALALAGLNARPAG